MSFRTFRAAFWVARFVFRFFSGRPLSGARKTDATFWTPARHSLDPSGKALRWEMMRGASRAAWRVGGLYSLLLLVLLPSSSLLGAVVSLPWYLSFSFLLWSHLLLFGGGALTYGLIRAAREHGYAVPEIQEKEEGGWRIGLRSVEGRKEWMKEKVIPISRVVSTVAAVHIPERKAAEWVSIPKSYREGGVVQIRLPERFTGDAGVQKRLVSSISARLGVPGMNPSWALEGSSPSLHLVAPPSPPERVSFSDVSGLLEKVEEFRPLLGLAGDGSPFYAEMEEDSPHIGLSAGPGAGKSTLSSFIIAQALRWGWDVVIVDWKQSSAFSWLGGLDGVRYISDIQAIHDFGEWLGEEIDVRKRDGMAGKRRILVVRDEWNVTAPLLYDYYAIMRSTAEPEEKRAMPARSPALSGYAKLDFAGREYGLHDFCVAQKFSARIFNGNADQRECFGIKLLARYTPQTQKMLAPDIKPFPRKSNHRGRWTVVIADQATVIQSPKCTNEELRAYAARGQRQGSSDLGTQRTQREEMRSGQGNELRPDATEVEGSAPVSARVNLPAGRKLSALVDLLEPFGVTHNVLRNAAREDSKGDPEFPKPVGGGPKSGYLYPVGEVTEWARRRHARMTVEKGAKK